MAKIDVGLQEGVGVSEDVSAEAATPVRLIRVEAQNIKRLKALAVDIPDDPMVIFGGKNAQGKSSALDSVAMALGGKRMCPKDPVRHGARKGRTALDLSNGLHVERTLTSRGGGQLTVSADGEEVKAPQEVLDRLLGGDPWDPMAWMRKSPKDQVDSLLSMVGLQDEVAAIDKARAEAYTARTDIGRKKKALSAQLDARPEVDPDGPTEVLPLQDVLDQMDAAKAQERALQEWTSSMESYEDQVLAIDAEIDRLQVRRKEIVQDWNAYSDTAPEGPERSSDEWREELDALDRRNAEARKYQETVAMQAELDRVSEQYDGLTEDLATVDQQKRDLLAGADLPLDGLALGDDCLLYQDAPLDQASHAEQIRVAVALALKQAGPLKILLVHDGSLLDEDSLALLEEISSGLGGMVLLEKVGAGPEVHFILEDGEVV